MLLDVHLIKCVEEVEENIVLFFQSLLLLSFLFCRFFLAIFCNPPEGGRGEEEVGRGGFFVMFFV